MSIKDKSEVGLLLKMVNRCCRTCKYFENRVDDEMWMTQEPCCVCTHSEEIGDKWVLDQQIFKAVFDVEEEHAEGRD